MKKVMILLIAITLAHSVGLAADRCGDVGEVSYSTETAVREGEILLSESEATVFGLLATSIVAVGKPEPFSVQGEFGLISGIRSEYRVTTAAGAEVSTTVTCTHQGCVDPDCQPEGCEPKATATGWACTPPGCIQSTNQCGTQTPKGCTKSVSISQRF